MSGAAALPWLQAALVAFGAACGALLRWRVSVWLNPQWAGFPLGTLTVNCVGGLLIGAALAGFERTPQPLVGLLLVTGFLGGLTTFSAFAGETLVLLQRGHAALALAHVAAHVCGSLASAALGFVLLRVALT